MEELISVLIGGIVPILTQLAKKYKVNPLFVVAALSVVAGLGYALIEGNPDFMGWLQSFSKTATHGMAYSVLFYNLTKQFTKAEEK